MSANSVEDDEGDYCQHLEDFKASPDDIGTFRILHAVFVVCTDEDSKKTKLKNAFCHVCKHLGPMLHACLHCIFFGCRKHAREHSRTNNHCFSLELNYGQMHCNECGDYVYDAELDQIALSNKLNSRKCKKRLMALFSWEAAVESPKQKRLRITADSTIGLRGLLNLGSTCFMNCIVQALVHTPLLRDYFLSERHKCSTGITNTCFACELSRLFQEFYKGQRVPITLDKLLHMVWTQVQNLAGYAQQDAHEFFLNMLDVMHRHCLESMTLQQKSLLSMDRQKKCPCIIDQIFTGRLQSDLVCQQCSGVSTTIDATSDFSLDLAPVTPGGRPPSSLIDCLERFTRAEHLGSNAKIMCSNCQSYQESTKQLSMKTLPLVVTFHLKRFEHFNVSKKISTKISFPEMLDMTPFMSTNHNATADPIPSDNRYSLYAVVNHIGPAIHTGHFTAYIRQQRDYWYKCDDHVITRANLIDVLNSEGYLLFYHKHILNYD